MAGLSLLLGALISTSPPGVSVALDAVAPAPAGRLLLRLLEAGHPLLPRTSTGGWSLSAAGDRTGYTLRVRGRRTVSRRVEGLGPVSELELLQAAVEALATNPARPTSPPNRPGVHLVTPSWSAEAQGRVLAGLLAAGLGLAPTEGAATVVCVAQGEEGLRIGVAARRATCRPEDPVDEELVPAIARAVGRGPPTSVTADRRRPADPSASLDLSLGPAVRDGGVDPSVSLGLRVPWLGPTGFRLHGRLITPGPASTLDTAEVQEGLLTAGLDLERRLDDAWMLRTALLTGVLLHRYDVRGGRSGTEADLYTEVRGGLSRRLLGPLAVVLELRVGTAHRSRRHFDRDGDLWRRGRWQGGLDLGVRYDFGSP